MRMRRFDRVGLVRSAISPLTFAECALIRENGPTVFHRFSLQEDKEYVSFELYAQNTIIIALLLILSYK